MSERRFEAKPNLRIFHFGYDYVRFNFKAGKDVSFFDALFQGMSSNSNQKYSIKFFDVEFDVQFLDFGTEHWLQFSYFGDTVFLLQRYMSSVIAQSLVYSFSFYSTAFYVPQVFSTMVAFCKRYSFADIGRLDICCDIDASVGYVNRHYTTHTKNYSENWGAVGMESFYIGSKQNNKKHFIRVYDKKLDSDSKGKFHLFLPYFNEKCVTRIELQMNIQTCNADGVTVKMFLDDFLGFISGEPYASQAWVIFRHHCLSNAGTNFYFLDDKALQSGSGILRDGKGRRGAGLKDTYLQIAYIRTFLGYARRLSEGGIDPVELIQRDEFDRKARIKKV